MKATDEKNKHRRSTGWSQRNANPFFLSKQRCLPAGRLSAQREREITAAQQSFQAGKARSFSSWRVGSLHRVLRLHRHSMEFSFLYFLSGCLHERTGTHWLSVHLNEKQGFFLKTAGVRLRTVFRRVCKWKANRTAILPSMEKSGSSTQQRVRSWHKVLRIRTDIK